MRTRAFGKLGWRPSALGFGAMRLPVVGGDPMHIDDPEAIKLIRWAIDQGVTYVDTAYAYMGGGSEGLVGKALQDGYREKVKVATKSPVWLLQTPEDAGRYFDEQRQRLGVDRIDLYLLHGLNANRWNTVKKHEVLRWAERARAAGLIGHFGFSFHDNTNLFREIIDSYDGWEFCQIQYNYMDIKAQAGQEGLRYAAAKGLGVVVMEPLRGGALAAPPPEARKIFETAPRSWSPAEWSLQWLWNHPEVSVVLSGMSAIDQVRENVAAAGRSAPGSLTEADLRFVDRLRETILSLGWIPCTACGYCRPCPNGVDIPTVFKYYNDAIQSPAAHEMRRMWYATFYKGTRADECAQCGECEEKCPQHLAIRELLPKVHETLTRKP